MAKYDNPNRLSAIPVSGYHYREHPTTRATLIFAGIALIGVGIWLGFIPTETRVSKELVGLLAAFGAGITCVVRGIRRRVSVYPSRVESIYIRRRAISYRSVTKIALDKNRMVLYGDGRRLPVERTLHNIEAGWVFICREISNNQPLSMTGDTEMLAAYLDNRKEER